MSNKLISFKPNITERAFALAANGKYTFLVDKNVNKNQVRSSIESYFKVNVTAVNIINIPGKVKKTKGVSGRRKDISKAIVTLKKGEKIDIFEAEETGKDGKKKSDKKEIKSKDKSESKEAKKEDKKVK